MKISINQMGRQIWNNFKHGVRVKRDNTYFVPSRENIYEWWDQVGTEHNLRVCIRGFWSEFPVIEELEFKSEQDYTLFLLKWS